MQTDLQRRIDSLKTTVMMRAREQMCPVELVNFLTSFRIKTGGIERFGELDEKVQVQILEWESHPYRVIGN